MNLERHTIKKEIIRRLPKSLSKPHRPILTIVRLCNDSAFLITYRVVLLKQFPTSKKFRLGIHSRT